MRRNSEIFEKDNATFVVIKYFLAAILFFPLSFILWSFSNRSMVRIYSSIIAVLSVLAIVVASYAYVVEPLANYHLNFGIYGAVTYGGVLSVFFSPAGLFILKMRPFFIGCFIISAT